MNTSPTGYGQHAAPRRRTIHGATWLLQALLALAFLAHGIMFLSPSPDVARQLDATLPRWFQVFLGFAEVVAAVGLTLPGLTGIRSALVSWAAGGLMIVMVSAALFHAGRGEWSSAAVTAMLFGVATFVAYVRARVRPIASR